MNTDEEIIDLFDRSNWPPEKGAANMTTAQAKPTPGPWYQHGLYVDVPASGVDEAGNERKSFCIADCENHCLPETECEANAHLIAKAGTVYHETNLTPRQLAEEAADWKGKFETAVTDYENCNKECMQLAEQRAE